MSCKSVLSNSIKSNCEQQWLKSPTTAESNVKFAGEEAKDRLYEPKHKKKLVRVLTVVAYVFSVSLAAIMLSLYYIFIWNPKVKTLADGNALKPKCNCHEMMSEALKQAKTEDVINVVSSPSIVTDSAPVWQGTTEDLSEPLYDEASLETKIDEKLPRETSMFNYDIDNISNETQFK